MAVLVEGMRVKVGRWTREEGPAFRQYVPGGAVVKLVRPLEGGRLWSCEVEGNPMPSWISASVLAELVRDGREVK